LYFIREGISPTKGVKLILSVLNLIGALQPPTYACKCPPVVDTQKNLGLNVRTSTSYKQNNSSSDLEKKKKKKKNFQKQFAGDVWFSGPSHNKYLTCMQ